MPPTSFTYARQSARLAIDGSAGIVPTFAADAAQYRLMSSTSALTGNSFNVASPSCNQYGTVTRRPAASSTTRCVISWRAIASGASLPLQSMATIAGGMNTPSSSGVGSTRSTCLRPMSKAAFVAKTLTFSRCRNGRPNAASTARTDSSIVVVILAASSPLPLSHTSAFAPQTTVNVRPPAASVRGAPHCAVAVADVVIPSTSSVIVDTPDDPAAKIPCSSIVPVPAVTLQLGVTGTLLPHSSNALAENATVSRGLSVAAAGSTRTVRGAPGLTVIFVVAASSPSAAFT